MSMPRVTLTFEVDVLCDAEAMMTIYSLLKSDELTDRDVPHHLLPLPGVLGFLRDFVRDYLRDNEEYMCELTARDRRIIERFANLEIT